MSRTPTELADQVLRELEKLDAIEPAAFEDSDYIQKLSESYHATLSALGVNVTWDHSEIPNEAFIPLAGVLADVAARAYGANVAPEMSEYRLGLLRRVTAFPYLGTTLQAEYY